MIQNQHEADCCRHCHHLDHRNHVPSNWTWFPFTGQTGRSVTVHRRVNLNGNHHRWTLPQRSPPANAKTGLGCPNPSSQGGQASNGFAPWSSSLNCLCRHEYKLINLSTVTIFFDTFQVNNFFVLILGFKFASQKDFFSNFCFKIHSKFKIDSKNCSKNVSFNQ